MYNPRAMVRTLGCSKVYHVSVLFEHVDFLNRLDGLDIHLLQRCLQFLVVCAGGFVDLFGLSPRCTFASVGTISSITSFEFVNWIRRKRKTRM